MYVLYPSYSFETISLDENDSNELLSAYSALFHPAVLEHENGVPTWESAYYPPAPDSSSIIIVPPCCEPMVDAGWLARRAEEGVLVVRDMRERDEIVPFLLENLGIADHGFDSDLIADLLALGTTAFLTDLLTRQLRYMSMLDNAKLHEAVVGAIRSDRAGNAERRREFLVQAFSLLSDAKDYFYPAKTYLLNLLLVRPNDSIRTLGPHLAGERKTTLLLPSETLRILAAKEPDIIPLLRASLESGAVQVIGDDSGEGPLFLLPPLEILRRIKTGIDTYLELLGRRPVVFGRTHAGLTPILPQLLHSSGYRGVLHFAPLDGWRLGDDDQSVMQWQGLDGTTCDALIRYPIDAADSNGYADLASKLGRIIDNDRAASIVFAHFSTQATRWLDDLLRMDRYAPSLGEFLLIDDYFEKVAGVGPVGKYGFERYGTYELTRAAQAGEPDPVARWTDLHRSHAATRQRGALDAIRAILPFAPFPTDTTIPSKILSNLPDATAVPGRLILNPLNAPRTAVLDISDFEHLPRENRSIILSRESKRSRDADSSEPPRKEIAVRVPPMGYVLVTDEPDEKEDTPQTRAGDVPEALRPKGLLRTGLMRKVGTMFSGDAASSGKPGPEPPLAYRVSIPLNDGGREVYYVLRNDHFEVRVDALSGAMIALRVHAERGNRLAMQIARRLSKKERDADERSEDDSNYGYSIMSADEIVVESAGPITGRLRISGRLIHPDGRTLARFIQRQTVRRVGRSIEVQLELTPEISEEDAVMKDEPWDSYFAVRWAWGDETHDLYGGVHEGRYPIDPDARCLQLPEFIDLRNETESITLLTNGLPYHRRYGFRRLDTILLSGEELRAGDDTQGAMRTPDEQPDEQPSRTFRFGYAHNAGDPVALSREFALLPEEELVVRTVGSAPPVPMADWLYFIESRNVSCIHWAVLPGTARLRATLLESEGLAANCRFRCRRPILSAIRLNLLGEPGEPLEITEGEIAISMRPHEILPIEFEVACPV